eukprot:8800429-Lingulodinium_polyedra.AAC.1
MRPWRPPGPRPPARTAPPPGPWRAAAAFARPPAVATSSSSPASSSTSSATRMAARPATVAPRWRADCAVMAPQAAEPAGACGSRAPCALPAERAIPGPATGSISDRHGVTFGDSVHAALGRVFVTVLEPSLFTARNTVSGITDP